METPLVTVHALLARQNELVTRSQLFEANVSRGQLDRLVHERALKRMRRGVYALSGVRPTWERTLHAAVLAAGDSALASHSSAARLWRFQYRPDDRLEITVPRERFVEVEGVRIHRSLILPDADCAHRESVPCTSFERTLCDNTSELTEFQVGRTLDEGLRRGAVTLKALAECVGRLESARGRRLAMIRRLLGQRGMAFDPGGSNAELRVLRVLDDADLPLPKQQHRVRVAGRTYILDYAYPDQMGFIEYYELRSHGTPSAVAYDSERLNDLTKAGWRPLVFTDATSDRRIVEDVASMLGFELDSLEASPGA